MIINRPAHTISRRHGILLLIAAFVMALTELWASAAVPALAQEYRIKATYLYKFAHFVEWPGNSGQNGNTPFTICVIGKHDLIKTLEEFAGKSVKKRNLLIRQARTIDEIANCQVLFISPAERMQLTEILTAAEKQHILTVSDMQGFAQAGGIIHLVNLEDKIRFDINIKAAKQGGLVISSQLLQLAHDVIE